MMDPDRADEKSSEAEIDPRTVVAFKYGDRRNFNPGRGSTLRKTMKLYRLAGVAPEPSDEEKARHVHPRRLRRK